jgi:membrane protease YdiL (CAAX protease family)
MTPSPDSGLPPDRGMPAGRITPPPEALARPDEEGGSGAPPPDPSSDRAPSRLGVGTFTIEGREAPALFVVGWLATIAGLALVLVGALGGGTPAVVVLIVGLALLSVGLVAGTGSQAIERRARGTADYWGPSPFLVFAAVIPLTVLLQALAGLPLVASGLDPGSPLASFVGLLVTAAVYLGLVRLVVVGPGALSWLEMGVRWPGRLGVVELVYGAAIGVPLVFVSGLIALLLSQLLAVPESPLPEAGGPIGALLNIASAAVIAPIAEEIFFRGFATTAWLRSLGANPAIVRGAIFFAAVHILTVGGASFGEGAERALFAFLVRLPVALALGWVFVRRGSLVAAIGLHAAYNGVPVLALLLAGR